MQLVEKGVKITTLDRKPFVEASQKVYKEWAEKVGGMDLIERIIQFDYNRNKNSVEERGRK